MNVRRTNDCSFLQWKRKQRKLGRPPRLVAADAGYYSRANEETAHEMGA